MPKDHETPKEVVSEMYVGSDIKGRVIKSVHSHPSTKGQGSRHHTTLDQGRLGVILEFADGGWTYLCGGVAGRFITDGDDNTIIIPDATGFQHGYKGEREWAFTLGLISQERYEAALAAEDKAFEERVEADDLRRYKELHERFGEKGSND